MTKMAKQVIKNMTLHAKTLVAVLIPISIAVLLPGSALAGGKSEQVCTPQTIVQPSIVPQVVTIPQPAPVPLSPPITSPSASQSVEQGNGEIYCSSPTAPGWRVDLPGGGCTVPAPVTLTKINYPKKTTYHVPKVIRETVTATSTPQIVPLVSIPFTGYRPTLVEYLRDLLFGVLGLY